MEGVLEWVFEDLVRFVYPASDELIDWKAPVVFMDKELAALVPGPTDEMTVRVVDKLVKVRLKKRKAGAYVHVEVQCRTEKQQRRAFGERMFHYFRLVRGKYTGPLAAIAIYCGGMVICFRKAIPVR